MSNYIIGLLCFVLAVWITFFSPKEGRNIFGYKSPQGMNKNIWKWSNKCFGILAMIGSFLYLLITLIAQLLGQDQFSNEINKYAILYIFVSIIITEVFTFVRSRKSR